MSNCSRIAADLELLAAGELEGRRRRRVERHLGACPDCRLELAAWHSLLTEAAVPAAEMDAAMETVDWPAVADRIVAGAKRRHFTVRRPRPVLSWPRLAAAAALATVVGLGLFFLGRATAPRNGDHGGNGAAAAVLARLHGELAREEAGAYLRQSQLLLTGVLRSCDGGDVAPWEMRQATGQARELLMKKRYLRQGLSALEWENVQPVSERIDWLSYELLRLGEEGSCADIARLQRELGNEKLLLKIRLLRDEFAARPRLEV